MAEFIRIGSKADLPGDGEAKEFEVNGTTVCVANVDGKLAAMDNMCVHRGGPLGQGVVMDGKVICPWHGWSFDPKTGISDQNSDMGVKVYEIKVESEDVLVELP
jgi:nitrite reductase (NADH) small subunit